MPIHAHTSTPTFSIFGRGSTSTSTFSVFCRLLPYCVFHFPQVILALLLVLDAGVSRVLKKNNEKERIQSGQWWDRVMRCSDMFGKCSENVGDGASIDVKGTVAHAQVGRCLGTYMGIGRRLCEVWEKIWERASTPTFSIFGRGSTSTSTFSVFCW